MVQHPTRTLVAYESLFGATRRIAEAIAAGIREGGADVDCRSVREVSASEIPGYGLLVLGAPTHSHTMPTADSRAEGERWLEHRMRGSVLEPHATNPGMREWIAAASFDGHRVAPFTTRVDLPRLIAGSAASAIGRLARKRRGVVTAHGLEALVDDRGSLLPGETDRARGWGIQLVVHAFDGAGARG